MASFRSREVHQGVSPSYRGGSRRRDPKAVERWAGRGHQPTNGSRSLSGPEIPFPIFSFRDREFVSGITSPDPQATPKLP